MQGQQNSHIPFVFLKKNERNWVCPICKGQSQTYAQSCEH